MTRKPRKFWLLVKGPLPTQAWRRVFICGGWPPQNGEIKKGERVIPVREVLPKKGKR